MKKLINKHSYKILGVGVGAITGFLYWKFIGCASGTCPITSNPVISTVYGAVLGALLLSTFEKDEKKSVTRKKNRI